jgi:hypothetical protein
VTDTPHTPRRPGGPRGWIADLLMGCRLAISGGREGWLRLSLTAVGIGLGVAMLLIAASIPTMFDSIGEREARQQFDYTQLDHPGEDTMLLEDTYTKFRGVSIRGKILQPEGPDAPVPPGLDAVPQPGELYVSPALAELLESPGGALLQPRLGDAEVTGIIAEEGLTGPGQMTFYLGSDDLANTPEAMRIDSIGFKDEATPMHPMIVMIVVLGFTVLLLPVVMFVAVAVRFGGERRDRRLAALRLVGADRGMTRRVAAGESLLGAVAGLVIGVGFFLIVRPFTEMVTIMDFSVFAYDVDPDPVLATVLVVAVPLVAVLVSLSAMRRLLVEPLGVVRNAPAVKRRLWWRLVLPVIGVALLYPLFSVGEFGGEQDGFMLTAGVVVLLLGMATVLPWLVESAVRRLRGGSVSWQLATRRLQDRGGGTARVVNGIAVAAAGGIALQMLFTGVQADFVTDTGVKEETSIAVVSSDSGHTDTDTDTDPVTEAVADIPGASLAGEYLSMSASTDTDYFSMLIGDCDALRFYADIKSCTDGDVFQAVDPALAGNEPDLHAGDRFELEDANGEMTEAGPWTVPSEASTVSLTREDLFAGGLLVTPKALGDADTSVASQELLVQLDDAQHPDSVEMLRNAVEVEPFRRSVYVMDETTTDATFDKVRQGLMVGLIATMALIGLSLLVSTLEQLQERRRLLSVLVAFGTRRRSLVMSVLWQTAIPVTLGMLLAAVTGSFLGAVLLKSAAKPVCVAWGDIATIVGMGAAMILSVTILSLPALWRMMRPNGIRTE